MRFFAHHGVSHQELLTGNHFSVDLLLSFPFEQATLSDNLDHTLSYALVYEVVQQQMLIPSHLLEHLARRILDQLKLNFPLLTHITITVSKLNPPLPGSVASASVILSQSYLLA
jgi:dihydroneopterin aldolase